MIYSCIHPPSRQNKIRDIYIHIYIYIHIHILILTVYSYSILIVSVFISTSTIKQRFFTKYNNKKNSWKRDNKYLMCVMYRRGPMISWCTARGLNRFWHSLFDISHHHPTPFTHSCQVGGMSRKALQFVPERNETHAFWVGGWVGRWVGEWGGGVNGWEGGRVGSGWRPKHDSRNLNSTSVVPRGRCKPIPTTNLLEHRSYVGPLNSAKPVKQTRLAYARVAGTVAKRGVGANRLDSHARGKIN